MMIIIYFNSFFKENIKEFYRSDVVVSFNRETLANFSNCLINLFHVYKNITGIELGCPAIKLQKMLLILQIYYYKNYNCNIINLNEIVIASCGFKLPQVSSPEIILYSDTYHNRALDFDEKIHDDLFSAEYSYNPLFDPKIISDDNKDLAIELFNCFADFDPYELGKMLDDLKIGNDKQDIGKILSIDEFNMRIDSNYIILDELIKSFVENRGIQHD